MATDNWIVEQAWNSSIIKIFFCSIFFFFLWWLHSFNFVLWQKDFHDFQSLLKWWLCSMAENKLHIVRSFILKLFRCNWSWIWWLFLECAASCHLSQVTFQWTQKCAHYIQMHHRFYLIWYLKSKYKNKSELWWTSYIIHTKYSRFESRNSEGNLFTGTTNISFHSNWKNRII